MKKSFWIILIAVALLTISFFAGYDHLKENPENPISVSLAEFAAEQYIKNNLPGTEYAVTSVSYFDKDDLYYVTIACPDSMDKHFSLGINHIGTIQRDNYEYYILHKASTAIRINNEYDTAVKNAVSAPPESTEFFCYGHLNWETADVAAKYPGCILSDDLKLDKEYPLTAFGAQGGHIWFRVNVDSDRQINAEKMAELLLYVRGKLDAAGIPFATISASLQCSDSSTDMDIGSLNYEDLVLEGLEERIVEALQP